MRVQPLAQTASNGAASNASEYQAGGGENIAAFLPCTNDHTDNDDEQAEYHKGHWYRFEEKAPALAEEHIDAAVDKALDRIIARLI